MKILFFKIFYSAHVNANAKLSLCHSLQELDNSYLLQFLAFYDLQLLAIMIKFNLK